MKQQWSLKVGTRSVWERDNWGRRWTVTKVRGKNWKRFKNYPYFCQTRVFRDLSESLVQDAKTLKDKNLKKFTKCFSQLEGLPARELRAELWKSLSNPCDWTFHSRTSRQKWPASMRLRFATWLTCDWVAKIGQNWVSKIFKIWEQSTFQKHLKH